MKRRPGRPRIIREQKKMYKWEVVTPWADPVTKKQMILNFDADEAYISEGTIYFRVNESLIGSVSAFLSLTRMDLVQKNDVPIVD